ncbi:MAG: hypothetical protein NT016_01345 [Candidatus Aenigmarchaeota archaeon]|nr:hypothetical protein [Candidatus Aenigmarchaeota archaeon]
MGLITNVIGVALSAFAWFNPLALPFALQIALFILGFDMSGLLGKIALFALLFFLPPVLGADAGAFVVTLFIMLVVELLIFAFEIDRLYRLVLKPAAVFVAAYIAIGLEPALLIAGVDLLINVLNRLKTRKPGAAKPEKGGRKHHGDSRGGK